MKNSSDNESGGKHSNAINDAVGVMPPVDLVRLVWLQAGPGDNIFLISGLLRIGLPLHRKYKGYESVYFLGCGVGSGNQGYQAAGHGCPDFRIHPTPFCQTLPVY